MKKENKNKKIQDNKVQKEEKNLEVINKKEKKSSSKMKLWLSKTIYTVILIAIIILAYIGINLLIEKANITDIDLTADKVYSLSDTSKSIVKSIDQDVDIILVNMSNVQSVIDFSNKYSKENDKIKVQEISDVSQYPELAKKYNLTDSSYYIIVKSGSKEKIITTSDLYTYDYTTGQEKDLTEETMTNALLNVTIKDKPKIYFLTGHNDNLTSYLYSFKQSLENEANEVEDLDLLTTGKIPDDCSTLVITTLNEDIKTIEKDAIIKYIKKGGKIILFSDANVTKIKMPNFQKVLDEYGISISEGILLEQDTSKMLSGSPSAILVTVSQGSSITNKTNMNMNACFINAGKINFKDDEALEKLGVEKEVLATTSEKAFYRSDISITSTSKATSDEEGKATVGALLTKKVDDDTTSKLIVYSNNVFITNMQISINNQYYLYAYEFYNNEDLALNSISYLTDREDTILIRKDTETSTYTVTENQQRIILAIIFAVPALIIIAGIIIWQVRRRK